MLFFQQIERVADGRVGRAQHLVAMLDEVAVHVLVDHLEHVEWHVAALAQLLPAQHRDQNAFTNTALSVALEQ